MAVMLVGNRYISRSDENPGSVGFGYEWAQLDTGLIYKRNQPNTGWIISGDTSQNDLGIITTAGGKVSGALTGKHGLMPTDASSPFTTTPNVNGTSFALVTDLTTAMDAVKTTITTIVNQHAASTSSVAISKYIKFWSGTLLEVDGGLWSSESAIPFKTIPINVAYPDGSPISDSECSVAVMPSYNAGTVMNFRLRRIKVIQGSSPLQWKSYYLSADTGLWHDGRLDYCVLAIKTGA